MTSARLVAAGPFKVEALALHERLRHIQIDRHRVVLGGELIQTTVLHGVGAFEPTKTAAESPWAV